MTNTNTTIKHVSEATSVPSYSEFKPRLTKKAFNAPLTQTEQKIVALVGSGLDLGYVSFPLLYSRALSISRSERNALFNLVYNGRLILAESNCPSSYILQPAPVE